jgi:hypothetical protein
MASLVCCGFSFIFLFLFFAILVLSFFLFESDFMVQVVYVCLEGIGVRSGVGEGVNTDTSASFAPRIAISLQEQFDTGSQAVSRSTTTSVLRADVSFITDDDVGQAVEVFSLQLRCRRGRVSVTRSPRQAIGNSPPSKSLRERQTPHWHAACASRARPRSSPTSKANRLQDQVY